MSIIFKEQKTIDEESLYHLYSDVGWSAYTKEIAQLRKALIHSLYVVTAWENDQLIGLVRVIGDGLTIIYIQDILVLKEKQKKGIATMLMQQVLQTFKNVRQKVLLTEESKGVRHFYEKNGFQSCDKGNLVAFARIE